MKKVLLWIGAYFAVCLIIYALWNWRQFVTGPVVLAAFIAALHIALVVAAFLRPDLLKRFVGGITASKPFTVGYGIAMAVGCLWATIAATLSAQAWGWLTATAFTAYTILSEFRKKTTVDSTEVGAVKSFGYVICEAKPGPNLAPPGLAKIVTADKEWQMRFAPHPSPDKRHKDELFCEISSLEPVQLIGKTKSGNILDKPMKVFPVVTFTGNTTDATKLFQVVDTLEEVLTFLCEPDIKAFRDSVDGMTANDIYENLALVSRKMTRILHPQLLEYGLDTSPKGGGVQLSNIITPEDVERAQVRVREQATKTEEAAGKAKQAIHDKTTLITNKEASKAGRILDAEAEKAEELLNAEGEKGARVLNAEASAAELSLPLIALATDGKSDAPVRDYTRLQEIKKANITEVKGLEGLQTIAGDSAFGILQANMSGGGDRKKKLAGDSDAKSSSESPELVTASADKTDKAKGGK